MSRRSKTTHITDPDEAPLVTGQVRTPDRREVSIRWLSGTILTGVASTALMGTALLTALDGKQLLATPPEVGLLNFAGTSDAFDGSAAKTNRLISVENAAVPLGDPNRRRMSVSTVTRVGEADVIRTKPFEHLKIALARVQAENASYPPFNPLTIFAEGNVPPVPDSGVTGALIYGANVETEASITVSDFELNSDVDVFEFSISADEAESLIRNDAALLAGGETKVASVHYVDPFRFGIEDPTLSTIVEPQTARIIPQNVSVAEPTAGTQALAYKEDFVEARTDIAITEAFSTVDYHGLDTMGQAIATLLNSQELSGGQSVRLGLVRDEQQPAWSVKRASVYRGAEHLLTIALNDQGQYVPASEPVDRGIMAAFAEQGEENALPPINTASLPTVYDAIHRAVASHDLPISIADRIVKMVAADVDFRSRVRADDGLELFYSLPEDGEQTDDFERDLLFVSATFNGQSSRFYKFRKPDGSVGYYDEEGRSARPFLLRNPVPNGRFTSGFGMRIHPIHRYRKMHWGVDWAAPTGTPIIAPGNGTVVKMGWAGGYGRRLVVRHPNGYETLYGHLSRYGQGIQPGTKVKQGQVIARVGNTGQSTGPHLHYELSINGKRVDPLRVRLPEGNTLTGDQLTAFKIERDRINSLLTGENANETLAAL
ncbi:MAG: M23 family metallopeptidase [Pseudomonadota bacterium]